MIHWYVRFAYADSPESIGRPVVTSQIWEYVQAIEVANKLASIRDICEVEIIKVETYEPVSREMIKGVMTIGESLT